MVGVSVNGSSQPAVVQNFGDKSCRYWLLYCVVSSLLSQIVLSGKTGRRRRRRCACGNRKSMKLGVRLIIGFNFPGLSFWLSTRSTKAWLFHKWSTDRAERLDLVELSNILLKNARTEKITKQRKNEQKQQSGLCEQQTKNVLTSKRTGSRCYSLFLNLEKKN